MVKHFKLTIYKTIGLKNYLRLLHRLQSIIVEMGLFKKNSGLYMMYFVPKLIHKGDTVIDIGANLGYFTRIFRKAVSSEGKVYAVEPVKPFFECLKWALGKSKNVVLLNYALGTEEKEVQLSVPDTYGYIRTGLPKVVENENIDEDVPQFTFNAQMIRASKLFADIDRIDYIKCDIEGYEKYVIPEMVSVFKKHKPILQLETIGETELMITEMLQQLGYQQYVLKNNKLLLYDHSYPWFDFFFIPKDNPIQHNISLYHK